MPQTARHTDLAQDSGQNDADVESHDKPSALKLQADGKASDAAIRRMAQGENAVGANDTPAVAKASAGDSGMLTAELKTKLDGVDVTVPQGTYVVVKEVKGKDLICKVYSNFGGKEALVPGGSFKAEPALGHKSEVGHTSEPRDYTYQEYTSILWDGAPKAGDVAQGRLGDCYMVAAMGAVAAANPKAIMNLFSPQTPNQKSYTVNLYVNDGTGLKKHPITVDTNLPTRVQDVAMNAPTYALMGKSMKNHDVPLWPALLEKAYAQMMGGYDIMGDNGGYSDRAMEALTGVQSSTETVAQKPEDVLQQFKGFEKAGKAVCCGTLGSKHAASQTGFIGAADGPYAGNLKTDQGEAAEIIPNSLKISDKNNKAPRARDDGSGKLVGTGASGDVNYDRGNTNVKYDAGKGPAKQEDLHADYDWRGTLDTKLNVHAWHAYIFEKVEGDKLVFKNPWGTEHPQPMTAADFKRLFTGINSNQVPKEEEHVKKK